MLTIDEQLDQALTRIRQFESDTQASAALLAEASANAEQLTAQVTELDAERERLSADLAVARTSLDSLTKSKSESESRLAELTASNQTLEAAEQDIEKRASNPTRRGRQSTPSRASTFPGGYLQPERDREHR